MSAKIQPFGECRKCFTAIQPVAVRIGDIGLCVKCQFLYAGDSPLCAIGDTVRLIATHDKHNSGLRDRVGKTGLVESIQRVHEKAGGHRYLVNFGGARYWVAMKYLSWVPE
jgi:hypothetical protein